MVMLHVVEGLVKRRWYSARLRRQRKTPKGISGLELVAAIAAVAALREELREQRTLLFIDNVAARAPLISMYNFQSTKHTRFVA